MHPNLTVLVTNLELVHMTTGGPINSISIPLPPEAQGSVRVGGFTPGETVRVGFQTTVGMGSGGSTYNTAKHAITLPDNMVSKNLQCRAPTQSGPLK